jgi:hypothetical protein
MIRASTAAIASTVLARHLASKQTPQAAPAMPSAQAGSAGLRQYQVLQSRSEPAQLTLKLGRR